jgi:hypothetical protein
MTDTDRDVVETLQAIPKGAIDEESVAASPYSWREMAMKQARVPVLVGALVVAGFSLVEFRVEWYQALLAVAFVGYATLPAVGSYCYFLEERASDE